MPAAPKSTPKAKTTAAKSSSQPKSVSTPIESEQLNQLLGLVSRGWASELKDVADGLATSAPELVSLYRRAQRVIDAMRTAAKLVGDRK